VLALAAANTSRIRLWLEARPSELPL